MRNRFLQQISTGIILILVLAGYLNNNSYGNTQENATVSAEETVLDSHNERHSMLRQHLITRIR